MATRAILTHQPEVECDVCGRRLLRGERPDTFLASGHQRTVCELCVPRATHVGWMRASDAKAAASPGTRGRPGRSLIGRLRHLRQHGEEEEDASEVELELDAEPAEQGDGEDSIYDRGWTGGQPFDLEDDDEHLYSGAYGGAHESESAGALEGSKARAPEGAEEQGELESVAGEEQSIAHAIPAGGEDVRAALESFNVSECSGRIAGIARALGEPSVNVRQLGEGQRKVAIVVAWELCWYRYEVDLHSDPVTIVVAAEGMELEELRDEDRLVNASASERGELSLLL